MKIGNRDWYFNKRKEQDEIISKINSIENNSVFKKGAKKMWDIIYNYDKNN